MPLPACSQVISGAVPRFILGVIQGERKSSVLKRDRSLPDVVRPLGGIADKAVRHAASGSAFKAPGASDDGKGVLKFQVVSGFCAGNDLAADIEKQLIAVFSYKTCFGISVFQSGRVDTKGNGGGEIPNRGL